MKTRVSDIPLFYVDLDSSPAQCENLHTYLLHFIHFSVFN